jgi:hypothetical protein
MRDKYVRQSRGIYLRLLLEGYQGMQARKDRMQAEDRYHLDLAREWLVQLYQALGKPQKAAEWKKK